MAVFLVLITLFLFCTAWDDCSPKSDGHLTNETVFGPYQPVIKQEITWDGSIFYVVMPPRTNDAYPIIVFMHGSTGEYGMYTQNLLSYASQGFVVAFPFVKSPEDDKHWWVTNTDGAYMLKAVQMLEAQSSNQSSPLYDLVDLNTIGFVGHSMGATCTIKGSLTSTTQFPGRVKTSVPQHPGLCGPIGPPPYPATWMKSEFDKLSSSMPVLLTTATNDGAFRPAPGTANKEYDCVTNGGVSDAGKSVFIEFSSDACQSDGMVPPYDDGGHDCPFKFGVETPWVMTWLKLYLHHDGSTDSMCHQMVWNNMTDGSNYNLGSDPNVARTWIHPGN